MILTKEIAQELMDEIIEVGEAIVVDKIVADPTVEGVWAVRAYGQLTGEAYVMVWYRYADLAGTPHEFDCEMADPDRFDYGRIFDDC